LETSHYLLIHGLLLIHFVSIRRFILLLYNTVLLLVGAGHPAIGFGHLEVFLCGTLAAHVLEGEITAMVDVDRGRLDGEMESRDRMQSKTDKRSGRKEAGKTCKRTKREGLGRTTRRSGEELKYISLQRFAQGMAGPPRARKRPMARWRRREKSEADWSSPVKWVGDEFDAAKRGRCADLLFILGEEILAQDLPPFPVPVLAGERRRPELARPWCSSGECWLPLDDARVSMDDASPATHMLAPLWPPFANFSNGPIRAPAFVLCTRPDFGLAAPRLLPRITSRC